MSRTSTKLAPLAALTGLLAVLHLGVANDFHIRPVTAPVQHGEGCYWDDRVQKLYFVDIVAELVNRFNPATGDLTRIHFTGGGVAIVLPVTESLEEFVVTRGRDMLLVQWDGESNRPGGISLITSVDGDKSGNRFNDGKADRSGRVWAGTMGPEPIVGEVLPFQGTLYRVDPDSNIPLSMLPNVSVSNGLIWNSNSQIMYYIDSQTRHVDAFDYNIFDGTISNRRTVFDFDTYNIEGVPDGMTIDSNDNIWVAVFNGGQVLQIDPRTGTVLNNYTLPATRVTDVVFGGPNLDVLYVTTSRYGLDNYELAQQPLAGSVFEITGLNVRGVKGNTASRRCI